MKVRVKLGSQSQTVVFEQQEPSGVRLEDLRQSVSRQFNLENNNGFQLSLNQRDALSGEEQTLDEFGIVSGDLLHIIGHGLPQTNQSRNGNQAHRRSQPLAPYTSSSGTSHQHDNRVTSSSAEGRQEPVSTVQESPLSATESSMSVSAKDSHSRMDTREDSHTVQNVDPEINRYLLEPLVVRESTEHQVPVLLSQLFHSARCTCDSDALWVALHALVLESGFLPLETPEPTIMPEDWKRSGYYSCNYGYMVTADSVGNCSVVGVTVAGSILVHGLTKSNLNFKTEHLQLRCADFVTRLSEDVPGSYRALDRLSRQFKDTVCLPLINEIVTAAGFPERQGLQALPYEAKLRVLSFLDAKSLCHLGQTCQEFNSVYKDKTVWRILYIQAFGKPTDCSLTRNWYELFMVKYKQFLEDQDRKRRVFYMDDTDPPWGFPGGGPFRPVPGLHFPHIIGGDYDVNPEFVSGVWNPLEDRTRRGGPLFPQVPVPDPFSSGLGGPGLGLPGRGRPGARNLTGSPFSTNLNPPFM